MNPRTVGDSRGTSAWMCTLPSSTSTQRNTGVWHSWTRWSSRAFSCSSRGGQRRQLAGVVEQGLQPGGAVGGLEAGDDGVELGMEESWTGERAGGVRRRRPAVHRLRLTALTPALHV